MNQTKRCLQDFKNIKFTRVVPKGWFTPKDLEWNENLKHQNLDEFVLQYKLTVKS